MQPCDLPTRISCLCGDFRRLEHLFATVPDAAARRKLLSTLRVLNSAACGARAARTAAGKSSRAAEVITNTVSSAAQDEVSRVVDFAVGDIIRTAGPHPARAAANTVPPAAPLRKVLGMLEKGCRNVRNFRDLARKVAESLPG